jgi:hypothetical protein
VIRGRPAKDYISTSYVERFNLSSRMQMRRFTRLTNAFSKKLANHEAAIALWVCFYNLCRVHESLRCTPAMALGVTDHIWTIGELIAAAQEQGEAPPLPPVAPTDTLGGRTPFKPYVISGGEQRRVRDAARFSAEPETARFLFVHSVFAFLVSRQ